MDRIKFENKDDTKQVNINDLFLKYEVQVLDKLGKAKDPAFL